jgi:hypothetical protein
MRLFHLAQRVESDSLYIPHAMRAALGWHRGRQLYCWRSESLPDSPHYQLTLSPVGPNERDLWRLAARFHDRPGLLWELCHLLAAEGVNIITCRSATRMEGHGGEFAVEMELDTRQYGAASHHPQTELPDLYARIICEFIKEIVFQPDRRPCLRITPNPAFVQKRVVEPMEQLRLAGRGRLPLSHKRLARIEAHFGAEHGPLRARLDPDAASPLAFLVADTEATIVDITFFYLNTGYQHVRIKSIDRIGVLQTIARAFKDQFFNILQAYHRTQVIGESSETDLLLHHEAWESDYSRYDRRAVGEIEKIIDTPAMKNIGARVEFPGYTWRRAGGIE